MAKGAIKIPVGLARGKLITDCTVAELEDACDVVEAKICASTSEASIAKHRRFVNAARPLLKKRKLPTGCFETTEDANRALRDAAEVGHLVAPGTQMAALLPACALLITAFRADPKTDLFEDEEQEGALVPGKTLLDRIARELGLSWLGTERTDAQRDPFVRSYHAMGELRQFDATMRKVEGNAGIDLSQNSPRVQRIRAKATKRDRGELDVARHRQFIDSSCDTQARLKACRQLGIQPTYVLKDLSKLFFCAQLQFTGKTDDPELKKLMGQHVVDAFGPSRKALFGRRAG